MVEFRFSSVKFDQKITFEYLVKVKKISKIQVNTA